MEGHIFFLMTSPDTDSDGQPNAQNHMTNGKKWIWPANASYVALQFGSCHYGTGRLVPNRARRHDPDPAGVASFWGPRVREIEQPLSILFSDSGHPNIRMFSITNFQDWSTRAGYGERHL